jgi:hypothetical protein
MRFDCQSLASELVQGALLVVAAASAELFGASGGFLPLLTGRALTGLGVAAAFTAGLGEVKAGEMPRRSQRGQVDGEYCRRARGGKAPPGRPGGAYCRSAQSPFCLRLRDQIRVKVSPSSSTRLA